MSVHVALLRGINVSGQKLIQMERLRAAFAALGFGDVKTYIQSGNVVFQTAKNISPASLEKKIAGKIVEDFGFAVPVSVRTAKELAAVLNGNPWLSVAGIDQARLHVTFLSGPAPAKAEAMLQSLAAKPERFAVRGREIYLYCPSGYGETKLSNSAIEKNLSLTATTRNWKTVNALFAMAQT